MTNMSPKKAHDLLMTALDYSMSDNARGCVIKVAKWVISLNEVEGTRDAIDGLTQALTRTNADLFQISNRLTDLEDRVTENGG